MKKLLRLLFLVGFLSLFANEIHATHYMGGEITWECLSNGRYRFILKAYRECYTSSGSAANYGQTQTLSSTSPAGSITLTRLVGWPKDISPQCNNDTNFSHITCVGMDSANANLGAVEEHIFTSDANYPNGVYMNGVPPAAGWMFYWGSCCRNPSTNVVNANSKSWRLRAFMYPYNVQNAYPCFDNSPAFAEKPRTVVTTGLITFNNLAYDQEHDSLSYEWGQPLLTTGNPLSPYATGYSYQNPLPDSTQNPNNIGAVMDPNTGQVKLTSYTTGAFVTSIKVSSWRHGIKISEIWRDIQVVITSGSTNNPPTITPPFQNGTSYDLTVSVGSTVNFGLSETDFQFLPDGSPQTSGIKYFGEEFGDFISPSGGSTPPHLSSTTGCAYPPCATLMPAPGPGYPLEGQLGVQTQFQWVTDCDHLTDAYGNHIPSKTYYFLIKAYDDYCPVPGQKSEFIRITIKDIDPLGCPVIDSISYDYFSYDATLNWQPVSDPHSQFEAYYIYHSTSPNGPFSLIDSVTNANTSQAVIHLGPINKAYFYMKLRSSTQCRDVISAPTPTKSLLLTSMKEALKTDGFSLMPSRPNPASEKAAISFLMDRSSEVEYQLISPDGKLIESRKFKAKVGSNSFTIDVSALPNGVYYYSITAFGLKKSSRMVILR